MLKVMFCFYIKNREMIISRGKKIKNLLPNCDVVLATTEEEIAKHLPDVEVLVSTAFFQIDRKHLEKAKRLRFIQVFGVGTDHVDVCAAHDLGIIVSNVEGGNAVSVAEHVVMSALVLLRDLVNTHVNMKNGGWPFERWSHSAKELSGKTVGILGMGQIGQEVAKRFAPFNVSLLVHTRRELDFTDTAFTAKQVELGTLLTESDILSLHAPLTQETAKILNKENLFKMKKGAFLINTSRAGLVDESALISALEGHLAGAAIDVFSDEPLSKEHPLRNLPNIILTPHGSGVTLESHQRIYKKVVENVNRFLCEGTTVGGQVF